ncbi:hypothetical protein HPB49_007227 [Dermacentor silvarum]|uniref:Uncharacterized protein n=1 Tax=Dermacentor silvarum TaxID=543639 RepID=A0ACB8DW82_DERSI|nr:hypothetical protein HPB49_007227 [Dermacentor silvarum]
MRVKQRLLYLKQRDAFVGEVDYGDCLSQKLPGKPEEPVLATSPLCFVLSGLSTRYKIRAAYFFTSNCTGENFHQIMTNVLKEVESIGFIIVRIVTDSHRITAKVLQLLCKVTSSTAYHIPQIKVANFISVI